MMEVRIMRVPTVECQSELIKFFRAEMTPQIDRLTKGFEGECEFDRLVKCYLAEQLSQVFGEGSWIHLRDYNFSYHALTQIDSIVITPNAIHVYEIKNYDAECEIHDNTFYYGQHETFSNPFIQLGNIKLRFKGLLKQIGYNGKVYFHVVMINPNCVVKNAHQIDELIMRNELKTHFRSLTQQNSVTHNVKKLVTKIQNHSIENIHQTSIEVDLNSLSPGIICPNCGSLKTYPCYKMIECSVCLNTQFKKDALRQLIGELSILNQNQIIDNQTLYEFSGGKLSKKNISNRVGKILKKTDNNQFAYIPDKTLFDYQNYYRLFKQKSNNTIW